MSILKRFFDSYLSCSIHVGFAVMALTCITEISLKIPPQAHLHLTIFFGTIVGYNILKNANIFKTKLKWLVPNINFTIFNLIAFAIAAYHYLQLCFQAQLSFFGMGIIVLLYPFLRRYGLVKMFLVSFCVTVITVYIPSLSTANYNFDFFLVLSQRFLIVLSLLIPFEISDSTTDDPSLRTVPQQFGIPAAKIFGILLVIPFLMLEFFKCNASYTTLIVAIATVLFIYFSSIHKSKYYTSFWVESVPIFWWILLLVCSF